MSNRVITLQSFCNRVTGLFEGLFDGVLVGAGVPVFVGV
jgi:hypothetical protein